MNISWLACGNPHTNHSGQFKFSAQTLHHAAMTSPKLLLQTEFATNAPTTFLSMWMDKKIVWLGLCVAQKVLG